MKDADGDFVPKSAFESKHEAWLWDLIKAIKYKGEQTAEPLYKPKNIVEYFIDFFERYFYFVKKSKDLISEENIKQREAEILERNKNYDLYHNL